MPISWSTKYPQHNTQHHVTQSPNPDCRSRPRKHWGGVQAFDRYGPRQAERPSKMTCRIACWMITSTKSFSSYLIAAWTQLSVFVMSLELSDLRSKFFFVLFLSSRRVKGMPSKGLREENVLLVFRWVKMIRLFCWNGCLRSDCELVCSLLVRL